MQNALVLNSYREPARTRTAYAFVKRSFDIICSLLLIVLLMPVLLVVAAISAADTKSNPCSSRPVWAVTTVLSV